MIWILSLCFLMSLTYVSPQPVRCQEDTQCSSGYYCEIALNICRECINCEELKREPSTRFPPNTCIKSVVDCGTCKKGLVLDHDADISGECVRPDDREESAVLPPYVWALIVIGLLLFVVIVFYLLRHRDMFKVLASARTSASVRSQCYRVNATAPDFPPPYNPGTDDPGSGTHAAYPPLTSVGHDEELSRPFIKPAWPNPLQELRESDNRQSSTVFNPPAYEQSEPPSDTNNEQADKEPDRISLHDEDTVESPWTPNTSSANNNNNNNNTVVAKSSPNESAVVLAAAGASGSGASSAAGASDASDAPPPAKLRRTVQDLMSRSREPSAEPGRAHPQITLNLQCNNNMVFNTIV
ncbi:uncharacterized protein LOC101736142 isoform X1 [Bombyx mori]|uniref:TNFR-Cys domain-containing protein n=2 Tax=Bombyx mori TaxID=7091 RepID=A0A8R2C6Q8_BOMMO|nr:uncharacterized protein LOC101736142 isoform X1 [Bombyx mori]